jgi:hypothetical protein
MTRDLNSGASTSPSRFFTKAKRSSNSPLLDSFMTSLLREAGRLEIAVGKVDVVFMATSGKRASTPGARPTARYFLPGPFAWAPVE